MENKKQKKYNNRYARCSPPTFTKFAARPKSRHHFPECCNSSFTTMRTFMQFILLVYQFRVLSIIESIKDLASIPLARLSSTSANKPASFAASTGSLSSAVCKAQRNQSLNVGFAIIRRISSSLGIFKPPEFVCTKRILSAPHSQISCFSIQ